MINNNKNIAAVIDEEIELLEYVTAILRYKYRILLISILGAALMFTATFFMPVKYESFVKLALVEVNELGGVSPDNRRAPEAVTLVEQDFITNAINENYQDRIIARMRSRVFTIKFIKDNKLLPVIFHKQWDKNKQQWKKNFQPNIVLASEIFKHKICSINRNNENNLMIVKIILNSAQLSTDIANQFITDFNRYRRISDLEEADRKIKFLQETLLKTDFLEIQKSLYRLIEAQLVIKMLASNKEQYAIEVLDPAILPLYPSSPASKRITALTFIGITIFSIVFIIGRVVFKRIQLSIKQYQRTILKNQD
ncbi:MAG: hypothetical protein KZQ83_15705 [gamma proteobacterium symbiont of Taylorina sp.]|nr:hypothetical protein [gamma proteobacterium symbiont of Taylorina sp.]